jgi:hypothetical protein
MISIAAAMTDSRNDDPGKCRMKQVPKVRQMIAVQYAT